MDAVELARQRAAKLHDQAVARGRNPWQPYQFAVAEANRRDIDVESTSPGGAVLEGSRATFVPHDQLIVHERAGSEFEQAFLVAHELGHVELGDDLEDGPVHQIDPARSAEPPPVGMDRVVDYGRRQRREIQMDLFAREFLLPRAMARRLHLEDGLTATAIAERLGASFDFVAQQLLDALLLPPIDADVEAPQVDRLLNREQAEAAQHRGCAYLLEAGPGTGKTQTLVARVESLLTDGVDPKKILILTFSNKAAGEMAQRIAIKHRDAAAAMWIGTFHAFGLDLIRRFHAELGLPKDPRLMDWTEAVELLEHEFPRLGLVHYRDIYDPAPLIADLLTAISRAKDEVVDPRRYAELAESMRRRASTEEEVRAAEESLEVSQVYEAYERIKRQADCVDFGDLVSLPVRLLEDNDGIRASLRSLYDHVLVDEYQDVNRSSVRLLSALRDEGRNLWAVGDPKQSIYRFRGASSFNMARFGTEDFPGGVRRSLVRNYRSKKEVVDLFSTFATGMKAGSASPPLDADRGASGHSPTLLTVDQAEQQIVALADLIEEMRRTGHRLRDQAVLCPGNETISTLAHSLEKLGVPVLFLGNLFERPEVKDLFAVLTILTDRRAMGLVRLCCRPEFRTSLADVSLILEHLRAADHPPAGWMQDLEAIPGLSEEGRAALSKLKDTLHGFDNASHPWTVLASVLLDRTRIGASIASSADFTDRTRGIAIWQLMNFVRVQPRGQGVPITRLLDRVRRLVRLGDDRDLRQLPAAAQGIDAVRLMTIHGAKGLEFPVVHLPGLNSGTIPRNATAPECPPPDGMIQGGVGTALEVYREGQAEEQECLFYVALSRARDHLFLYAPTQKSNGSRWALSPFLDRLGNGLIRRPVTPARGIPAIQARDVTLSVEGPLRVHGQQIAVYERCPRRFLYTYVLQTGGRRTTTAFMQMHDAVRMVYQAVVDGSAVITTDADITHRLSLAFTECGLSEHGYVGDYEKIATGLVQHFRTIREAHTPESPMELRVEIDGDLVLVLPDDIVVRADGVRVFRSIRTGRQRSSDIESVAAAAFQLAVQSHSPDALMEVVHLTDQKCQALAMTGRQLTVRREKIAGFLQLIRQGQFPAKPSSHSCPSCPAFFVCGPIPDGTLVKKF